MAVLYRRLALGALGLGVCVAAACGDSTPPNDLPTGETGTPPRGDPPGTVTDGGTTPLDAALDDEDGGDGGFTLVTRDVNHVLGTGQSLSVGAQGAPVLSTTQPFDSLMFNTGPVAGGTGLAAFVPLVERSLETMSSSFAALSTQMAETELLVGLPPPRNKHRILVSVHGLGGIAYVGLKKGTAAYGNGIAQVAAGKKITSDMGLTYIVRAVTNVHGESDHVSRNATYAKDLAEWQADYDRDVRAITLQRTPIPMLQTQMSSWTRYGQAQSLIPQAQLDAHVDNPGKVILVGPKYQLPYAIDGVHLTNQGYREMGEQYAKVYRAVILEGKTWEPVRPKSAKLVGTDIIVEMHAPAPPLVFDTQRVTAVANMGFELFSGAARPPPITSVTLTGPTTVKVALAAAPPAGSRLRYAFTGTPNARAGTQTGPRGNLRDSDATKSRNGYALFNWCVHFDVPVQ